MKFKVFSISFLFLLIAPYFLLKCRRFLRSDLSFCVAAFPLANRKNDTAPQVQPSSVYKFNRAQSTVPFSPKFPPRPDGIRHSFSTLEKEEQNACCNLVRPNRFWRCSQTRPFTDLHVPHQAPNFLEKPLRWPSFWLRGTDSSFLKKKTNFFPLHFLLWNPSQRGFSFVERLGLAICFFQFHFQQLPFLLNHLLISNRNSHLWHHQGSCLPRWGMFDWTSAVIWYAHSIRLIKFFCASAKKCRWQLSSGGFFFFSTQNALFMTTRCRLLNQSTRSRTSCSNVCSSLIITFSFNLIEFQWSSDMQIRGHFNFRFQLIGTDRQRPLIRPHMTSFA